MRRPLLLCSSLAALAACSLPSDDPSTVHDLRILAISTTPPELQYPVQGTFQESSSRGSARPTSLRSTRPLRSNSPPWSSIRRARTGT